MIRTRILALSAVAVLAAGSLTGCGWLGGDDCDSDASATAEAFAKPGGGGKGGSKGSKGSKSKKTHKTGSGGHVDTDDDCDDD